MLQIHWFQLKIWWFFKQSYWKSEVSTCLVCCFACPYSIICLDDTFCCLLVCYIIGRKKNDLLLLCYFVCCCFVFLFILTANFMLNFFICDLHVQFFHIDLSLNNLKCFRDTCSFQFTAIKHHDKVFVFR